MISITRYLDIEHLASGTERQRHAYLAIKGSRILELLGEFSPVIAGTIPLDVDTEDSDLDVICQAPNLRTFEEVVRSHFGKFPGFSRNFMVAQGFDSLVFHFDVDGLPIEVFCQNRSVIKQLAVLHLVAERRLLDVSKASARAEIKELKRRGLKTEPAFASFYGIPGDPYEELAKIATISNKQLLAVARKSAALKT